MRLSQVILSPETLILYLPHEQLPMKWVLLNFFAKIGFSFLLFKIIAFSRFQNVCSTTVKNYVILFHYYAADAMILSEVIIL